MAQLLPQTDVGAIVFSGRPDPVWKLTGEQFARVEALWLGLGTFSGTPPFVPLLGYRGCFIVDEDGQRWDAFGGCVVPVGSSHPLKRDPQRLFERAILESAPAGQLPAFATI